jgi:hypothetical protein
MVSTAWSAGRLTGSGAPRLVFGRMHEDPEVEVAALPHGRVLAIASAGDVAFALAAAGRDVVAVDVNPAQVEYVLRRMAGDPPRTGQADRYLARAASLLPALGLTRRRLQQFFDLDDPGVQVDAWRRLAGLRFRAALKLAFGPALRLAYRGDLAGALPSGFGAELSARLERGFGIHPNRGNSYARALFGLPAANAAAQSIEVEHAEVREFLRAQPPQTFDGFAFSNITDGAPAGFRDLLLDAARAVARPGAVAVMRTLGRPRTAEDSARAATDRAPIWGGIEVVPLA